MVKGVPAAPVRDARARQRASQVARRRVRPARTEERAMSRVVHAHHKGAHGQQRSQRRRPQQRAEERQRQRHSRARHLQRRARRDRRGEARHVRLGCAAQFSAAQRRVEVWQQIVSSGAVHVLAPGHLIPDEPTYADLPPPPPPLLHHYGPSSYVEEGPLATPRSPCSAHRANALSEIHRSSGLPA